MNSCQFGLAWIGVQGISAAQHWNSAISVFARMAVVTAERYEEPVGIDCSERNFRSLTLEHAHVGQVCQVYRSRPGRFAHKQPNWFALAAVQCSCECQIEWQMAGAKA